MSCEGCAYAVLLSGAWCCDYLLAAGRRRPCPPGEGCTVRKEGELTKKGSAFMKRREWDTEKARALYDRKLSDAESAGKVGATASASAFWRRGLGLPANAGRRPAAQEEPETTASSTPPPSPMLERPENEETPVELSVKLDDGRFEFSIKAPSPEGARQIYQFAGRLLEEMGQIPAKREKHTI